MIRRAQILTFSTYFRQVTHLEQVRFFSVFLIEYSNRILITFIFLVLKLDGIFCFLFSFLTNHVDLTLIFTFSFERLDKDKIFTFSEQRKWLQC